MTVITMFKKIPALEAKRQKRDGNKKEVTKVYETKRLRLKVRSVKGGYLKCFDGDTRGAARKSS